MEDWQKRVFGVVACRKAAAVLTEDMVKFMNTTYSLRRDLHAGDTLQPVGSKSKLMEVQRALDNNSYEVKQVVTGNTGSGKSTMLNKLTGRNLLDRKVHTAGTVVITELASHSRRVEAGAGVLMAPSVHVRSFQGWCDEFPAYTLVSAADGQLDLTQVPKLKPGAKELRHQKQALRFLRRKVLDEYGGVIPRVTDARFNASASVLSVGSFAERELHDKTHEALALRGVKCAVDKVRISTPRAGYPGDLVLYGPMGGSVVVGELPGKDKDVERNYQVEGYLTGEDYHHLYAVFKQARCLSDMASRAHLTHLGSLLNNRAGLKITVLLRLEMLTGDSLKRDAEDWLREAGLTAEDLDPPPDALGDVREAKRTRRERDVATKRTVVSAYAKHLLDLVKQAVIGGAAEDAPPDAEPAAGPDGLQDLQDHRLEVLFLDDGDDTCQLNERGDVVFPIGPALETRQKDGSYSHPELGAPTIDIRGLRHKLSLNAVKQMEADCHWLLENQCAFYNMALESLTEKLLGNEAAQVQLADGKDMEGLLDELLRGNGAAGASLSSCLQEAPRHLEEELERYVSKIKANVTAAHSNLSKRLQLFKRGRSTDWEGIQEVMKDLDEQTSDDDVGVGFIKLAFGRGPSKEISKAKKALFDKYCSLSKRWSRRFVDMRKAITAWLDPKTFVDLTGQFETTTLVYALYFCAVKVIAETLDEKVPWEQLQADETADTLMALRMARLERNAEAAGIPVEQLMEQRKAGLDDAFDDFDMGAITQYMLDDLEDDFRALADLMEADARQSVAKVQEVLSSEGLLSKLRTELMACLKPSLARNTPSNLEEVQRIQQQLLLYDIPAVLKRVGQARAKLDPDVQAAQLRSAPQYLQLRDAFLAHEQFLEKPRRRAGGTRIPDSEVQALREALKQERDQAALNQAVPAEATDMLLMIQQGFT